MANSAKRSERLHSLQQRRAPGDLKGDLVLDTVGLYCPVPIIKTSERVRQMAPGQVIEVLSDDRVILADMPAWCLSTGHEYLGYRQAQEGWQLFVRRK